MASARVAPAPLSRAVRSGSNSSAVTITPPAAAAVRGGFWTMRRVRVAAALLLGALAGVRLAVFLLVQGALPSWSTPVEFASAFVTFLALAAAVAWAPAAFTRVVGPAAMVIIGTVPLLLSASRYGFYDADTEVQMRLLAVVLLFPALFSMSAAAFVTAVAVPVGVATAMAVVALSFQGGVGSSIYFFVVVLVVFSLTAYVLLRNRQSSAEAEATAARLEDETRTLHSLLTRRTCARPPSLALLWEPLSLRFALSIGRCCCAVIPETFVADLKSGRRVVSIAESATVRVTRETPARQAACISGCTVPPYLLFSVVLHF